MRGASILSTISHPRPAVADSSISVVHRRSCCRIAAIRAGSLPHSSLEVQRVRVHRYWYPSLRAISIASAKVLGREGPSKGAEKPVLPDSR
ncbi:hypothetical protein impB/mucB/samB [Aspergillus fumigatus]|nr:hypothetical protein impB/mucB/samB [Aspergillus fumigatus]